MPALPDTPAAPPRHARFQWSAQTQCFCGAERLELGAGDAESAPKANETPQQINTRTLRALYRGLRDGHEIRMTSDGVDLLPTTPPFTPSLQCQTSGSGGAPKAIRRSHASWIASFEVNRARFPLTAEDSYAVLGRLMHSLALYATLEAAHIGADLHLLADLRPATQRRLMAQAGVTTLYATPAQLKLLLRAEATPLPALRRIICGGGFLDADLRAAMASDLPHVEILEFYGASETSFITLTDAQTPQGSVGRAYPQVEIQIAPLNGEAQIGEAQIGEVWVKSPYLFEGYAMGESAETRWQDGFLTVGELGWLDPQGYLYLAGRKRRMVLIADQNTFPEEIESFLLAQAGVAHCAVIARPDPARGHHLVAVIGGPQDADLAATLDTASRAEFGPLKAPKRYIFMEDFPCLASGKPDMAALALRIDG